MWHDHKGCPTCEDGDPCPEHSADYAEELRERLEKAETALRTADDVSDWRLQMIGALRVEIEGLRSELALHLQHQRELAEEVERLRETENAIRRELGWTRNPRGLVELVREEVEMLRAIKKAYRHTHVGPGDTCAKCGFDLRNGIHRRKPGEVE